MCFKSYHGDYIQLSSSDSKVNIYKDTTINGNLDVGVGATSSKIGSHSNQQGFTAVTEIHSQSQWISKLELISTHPTLRSFIFLKGSIHFEFNASNQTIIHYKSLVHGSDDRLKENEELIENACETLGKLRPQLYDKKPDIDNDDPTAWYKEVVS